MTRPPPLAQAFPQWGLRHHLKAWRMAHKRKRIEPGASFIAPDGQGFTVTGKMFWRYAGRKRPAISLVWQSRCAICGKPYTFNQPFNSGCLVRTCPAHRGEAKPLHRTPLRDIVLSELESLALLGSAPHGAIIDACAARLAAPKPGQRDTRRQRVVRCLQELVDKRALPEGVTLTDESFICN